MARAFANGKSIFWLAGVFVLIVGFVVAALVLPATSKTAGTDQPAIQVPKMQNVPSPDAPKMRLETGKDQ
jgi:hypothetical protein